VSHKIIRTKKQIGALIDALEKELKDPRIVHGREESQEWIVDLRHALETGEVRDPWNEAGYWLVNEQGWLGKDYGVT